IRLVENVVEDASAKTAEETIELHRKLLEIAHANVHAYFEWLHEIVKVDSPSDFTAVCMKHSQQQFETFRQQTRELGALGQKAGLERLGASWIRLGQSGYWPALFLLNYPLPQTGHGAGGPVPVTAPPRRNLRPRTRGAGTSFAQNAS